MKKLFIVLSLLCASHLATAQSTDETEALRHSALDKEEQSNYLGAIADYTKAIAIEPKEVNWYVWRADDLQEIEDYQSAVKDMDTAISLEPDNIKLYEKRSWLKEQVDDTAGALADAEVITVLKKKQIEELNVTLKNIGDDSYSEKQLLRQRADLLMETKQYEKAIADWLTLNKLAPEESTQWYFNIGDVYKNALQSDEKALDYYTLSINSTAEKGDYFQNMAYVERAIIRVAQGDVKSGCADYRKGESALKKDETVLYPELPACGKK